MRHALSLPRIMCNPQHSETRPYPRTDQRLDRRHGSSIEGRGRLIEQQHLWPHGRVRAAAAHPSIAG
jgi:hypothetical protein